MPHTAAQGRDADGALECLAMLCQLHNRPVNPDQLRHHFPSNGQALQARDLMRVAAHLGFKSKAIQADWARLQRVPLPAIVKLRDGRHLLLARLGDDERVLVHDPLEARPMLLPREVFEPGWSGEVVVCRPSDCADRQRRFGLSWFIPVLIKYRRLFGEILLASLFVQLFALLTPLFFQVVIDKVLVHKGLTTLDVLALGLLCVALFEVVLAGVRDYLLSHTTNRIDVELGAKLYRHLLALPLGYFRARRVGDSVARVRELENIRSFITGSSLTVVLDLSFTLVFLVVLYYYSPTLTWIVGGAVGCYGILSLSVTPVLRARLNAKFTRGAENQAFLVESITGVETVKSMAVEPTLQRRWEEQLAAYVKAAFKATHLANLAGQAAQFVNKLMVILIIWIGARLVMQGDLTVGQLVAFNMLAMRVSAPVLRLVQLWQDFQQALISVRKLGDILNTPTEQGAGAGRSEESGRLEGLIEFQHVTFRYGPDQEPVLSNIDLRIRPGEVLGVVGRSGSGKSTLAKLVQRLYVPEKGRLLVDGVDLNQVDMSWLRRQIGSVLQDSLLFNRTIRENIALRDPAIPMQRVIAAARAAGAHEFIQDLPKGYETYVAEQGATLSGGQRQRIAIARALINDPSILIFDEATSALDYESQQIIQRNMRVICRGRTAIIIAHRLSAVRDADRIVVLEAGRVIEEGSHEELLEQGGLYAHLQSQQAPDESTGGDELLAELGF